MICCTELYQNLSRTMECTCRNALTYLRLSLSPFRKLYPRSAFSKNSYHEVMVNLTEDLAFDTEQAKDGRTDEHTFRVSEELRGVIFT
jgi:hypothetical protein